MTPQRAGFRAVIFDMDGVIVDSEPAFHEAVNLVLRPTGKQIAWEDYVRFIGTSTSVTWRGVLETVGLSLEGIQPHVDRFESVLLDVLGRPRDVLPGVLELIEALGARSLRVGLATSSREEWVRALLGGAELPLDTFDTVVWRQMVKTSKPAPDLYLRAAELLSIPPERCIAIEDTIPGIGSAKAAGMYAIQVRASSTALPPIGDADAVLDSLDDFPFELIAQPGSV